MLTFNENLQSSAKLFGFALISIALHITFFMYTSYLSKHVVDSDLKNFVPLKVTIEKPPPLEVKKEEVTAPQPKKILRKKSSLRNTAQAKVKPVKPVLGLPPESHSKSKDGLAVPIGNTTMTGDEGKRLKDVHALPVGQDLGTQPLMIRSSVEIPEYTQDALDNNIVGTFTIDVYVDENGEVQKAELQRKVGYGMDEKIIEAAKKVRFIPGKDRNGKETGVWTQIKFRLEIP